MTADLTERFTQEQELHLLRVQEELDIRARTGHTQNSVDRYIALECAMGGFGAGERNYLSAYWNSKCGGTA